MNNQLQIFNNPEFGRVRVIEKDGQPWFVGKDVADALGYSNSSKAVAMHVDEEDKAEFPIWDGSQNRNTYLINESGVYSLVLTSKISGAKKFKRWVTSEVLPSIRKHGTYMTDETLERALTSPDFLIQLATQLKREKEEKKQLQEQIEKDRPKVIFAEALEISESSILVGDLARILRQNGINIGQNRLFEVLRKDGYLISRKGESYNMPTQKSMDLGLFEIKVRTVNNPDGSVRQTKTPKVTGKGQIYFINKFKKVS